MPPAGFRWIRPPSELGKAIDQYAERVVAGVGAIAEFTAADMQNRARTNASWTDRTGNARSGLFGVTARAGYVFRIILGHTVHYGIYLELSNGMRYAIVMPTIEATLPELEAALKRLLS